MMSTSSRFPAPITSPIGRRVRRRGARCRTSSARSRSQRPFPTSIRESGRSGITCAPHNLESELLRLYTIGLKPALLRHYVRMQADRVEALERWLCPQFDLNVMVSEVDAERLRAIAPGSATVVVPNGTDTDYFQP